MKDLDRDLFYLKGNLHLICYWIESFNTAKRFTLEQL